MNAELLRRRPSAARTGTWLAMAALIAVAILLPAVASPSILLTGGDALILALFAMSLNLLVGTTGLVSFGHAAYFGVGAFAVALLVAEAEWPPMLALLAAPVLAAGVAALAGLIVLRGRELYFSLLTLGVAQLLWALARAWTSVTGGENGVNGFFAPRWLGFGDDRLYWFVLACVVICVALLYVVTRSAFGSTLRLIRENRVRAEFIGLEPKRYEFSAFVIAGAFAGVAGALAAIWQGHADAVTMDWRSSANPLIAALIGGVDSFAGPFVGAIFYTFLQEFVVGRTELWDLIIGAVVLTVALTMPRGIVGSARRGLCGLLPPVRPAEQGRADPVEEPAAEPDRSRAAPAPASPPLPDGEPVLRVRDVTKRFGGLTALTDVSLEVRPGTIHAIIGPNGAGKTTLFNVITAAAPPDEGTITLEGHDVTRVRPAGIVRRGVVRSFQKNTLFWELTAFENLLSAAAVAREETTRLVQGPSAEAHRTAWEILDFLGLRDKAASAAITLSHGDQRGLEIGLALACGPQVLLLDEPTAGLSPSDTVEAVALIQRVARQRGLTVVFIEHDMDVVFGIADRITVLHRGQVLADGEPDDIARDAEVQEAYLGTDDTRVETVEGVR
jgi:ABC-type branched-subunit amino acid transport system ATPase component/ABC-type branched-subunit amino acid transport system permease subunit